MRNPHPFFAARRISRFTVLPALAIALALAFAPPPADAVQPVPCGIFVSATQGTDDGTCGLDPNSPCATINHGVTRANSIGASCLFVQAGFYNEILVLSAPPLNIVGGYDTNWNYAPKEQLGHLVTIVGGQEPGTDQFVTVMLNPGADVALTNLQVQGPNASGSGSGGIARSSYAIHAVQAALTMDGVRVVGGNGAAGTAGANGTSATQTPAAPGQNGGPADEFVVSCDNTSRGAGGAPGIGPNSTQNGGAGGAGGTMDTDCTIFQWDYTNTPGQVGFNAFSYQTGVFGYRGGGGAPCGPGGNGLSGLTVHGSGGTGAPAGGVVIGNFWVPNNGGTGQIGNHGTGGGGGGGSGGCDKGTDS